MKQHSTTKQTHKKTHRCFSTTLLCASASDAARDAASIAGAGCVVAAMVFVL
jgi:hypothetical protein